MKTVHRGFKSLLNSAADDGLDCHVALRAPRKDEHMGKAMDRAQRNPGTFKALKYFKYSRISLRSIRATFCCCFHNVVIVFHCLVILKE
jgi:hypothetical protein